MPIIFSSAITTIEPECKVDSDCAPKKACIQGQCQNPCAIANPCEKNQACVVASSSFGRPSVACVCPEGHVSSINGYCQPGTVAQQCQL
jgi:hypothetical protein